MNSVLRQNLIKYLKQQPKKYELIMRDFQENCLEKMNK